MFAEYDDPVFYVLAMVSAVLRLIGNMFNLIKNIGGKIMKIKNTVIMKLAYVVETLLVVGNLGGCLYPATGCEGWGRFPHQTLYIHHMIRSNP